MSDVQKRSRAASYLDRCAERLQNNAGPIHIAAEREDVMQWWDRFKSAHHAVCNITLDDEGNAVNMELYDSVKASYGTCLRILDQRLPTPPSSTRSDAPPIQIEPITLLTFRGEPMKWLEFRDQFVALVHDRDLDPNHKLAVLRKYVKVEMVELAYTGNYEDLWKKLCERFNDMHSLAKAWTTRWTTLQQVPDTREGLTTLVDETRAYIRAFALLKRDISNSTLLYCMLLEKLPEPARAAWGFSVGTTDIPTLEDCLVFIERRFKTLPESTTIPHLPSGPYIHAGVAAQTPPPTRCACPRSHNRFSQCPVFNQMNAMQRMKFVADRGQCVNCFSQHAVPDCKSPRNCYKCQARHHHLLCPHQAGAPAQQPQSAPRH